MATKVLVVDVGGTHVKILSTGQEAPRKIVSGPRLTPQRMVSGVKKLARGWTYDGVSIAWAVSEHLHNAVGCKTIFATHYHELTQLADNLVAVRNYNVQVREVGDEVLFLHRLQPGGADRSYGIEVGRLAGLPPAVLKRAAELLKLLEAEQIVPRSGRASPAPNDATDSQLALFGVMPHPVVQQLRKVDPNTMTPIQALEMLARLVDEVKRDGGTA